MRYSGEMRRDGINSFEAASRLGIPEFAVRAAIRVSRDYTPESLRDMCRDCVETEYAVKSGRLNPEGSLESVMLKLITLRSGEN